MAILSDTDRAEIWAAFMRELSSEHDSCSISKAALRAAFNAADDWVEANKASFNTAIPQPARANLTAEQKARLLMHVVRQRFVKGA